MNIQEQELLEALRAEFAGEARERLQAITAGLLELEQGAAPDQESSILERIYRNAHNLKGEARAVNFVEIETLCQSMETILAAWKKPGTRREPLAFDALHSALDRITRRVSIPETHSGFDETVRIPLSRLEALILRFEEMLAVKLTTHHRAETLRETLLVMEQWKHEGERISSEVRNSDAKSGLPARLDEWMGRNHTNIAILEGTLSSLSRDTDLDDNTVSRLVDSVLHESKKLLILPFSTLLEIIPKLVRDLSRDQGKEIDVTIRGGDIEVDKRMLQELKDPIIHLVRNSVDHGIETTAVRQKRAKPARGNIVIEVRQADAGKVELVVRDDGEGIDAEAVKAVAIRRGIISNKEASRLTRDEAVALIFRSDISTSPLVTTVSGRGLGMAIVKERVEILGGRLFVETREQEGTAFRMVLPLTLATFRGIVVDVAGQWFIVPSASVERVGRIRRHEVFTEEDRSVVTLAGRTTPFVRLADVLAIPASDNSTPEAVLVFVMISEASDRRVMFCVDSVVTEDEVLVKAMAKPLSRVRNVAGATVLASGKVVPILNVPDLMKSVAHPVAARQSEPGVPAAEPAKRKRVLLAEDSIISRMLFKSILESAGYAVKTTVDGEEAWNAIQTDDYDAVVSDIEMPRLDGLQLTARIRGDARVAGKPVILVTGRAAPEDRERGLDVGANAYIVKSSFDQSDLLDALRKVM